MCSALLFGKLSRGPKPTEDCWATVNRTLLGNQRSSRTEQSSIHGGSRLPSRFSAAKSFSVTCSASPLRQSFHAAQSQQRTVGPPSMERFSVTKNRPVPNSRPFTVARDSVSILCSRIIQRHVQRITSSAKLSRGPEPTEDCWATVNGTLLGNQKSSSTEQSSIHGGSRLLSRFSAAKSFSVTCSVVGYSLASHPQWLA